MPIGVGAGHGRCEQRLWRVHFMAASSIQVCDNSERTGQRDRLGRPDIDSCRYLTEIIAGMPIDCAADRCPESRYFLKTGSGLVAV